MNRDMARVLGALSAVLLFAGLVVHDAGAQEALVGTWKLEGGGTLEIGRDQSDPKKFTLKQEGQADQTFDDLKDVIARDPDDPGKWICLDPPCSRRPRIQKVE